MSKKLLYILITIIFCTNSAFCETRQTGIHYDGFPYSFSRGDDVKFAKNANINFTRFENAQTPMDKLFYLKESMRYNFLLIKMKPESIDAHLGLARVYDELMLDKYAKEHFFIALNLDNKNPKTNYYFGNYYYRRKNLLEALFFYKRAYQFGYSKNYELDYRLGTIYEKLADIEAAKKFYQDALKTNPMNTELSNKIHLLDELNYNQSQYYLFKK